MKTIKTDYDKVTEVYQYVQDRISAIYRARGQNATDGFARLQISELESVASLLKENFPNLDREFHECIRTRGATAQ